MDCAVCKVRSSMGFCVECHMLLCEQCSTTCVRCGKLMCPDHVHETRGGRVLCIECMDDREARRKERAGDAEVEKEEETEEVVVGDEALVVSARRVAPPWQLSLWCGGAAIAVLVLIMAVPGLAKLTTPWGSIPVILVSGFGIFWAVFGLRDEEHLEDRPRCFLGLIVSVILLLLGGGLAWSQATERAEERRREQIGGRDYETPEQREEWRKNLLQKYER